MLNGSRNANGCTFTALSEVGKELTEAGIDFEIVHIGKDAMSGNIDALVKEVTEKLKEADGLMSYATNQGRQSHPPDAQARQQPWMYSINISSTARCRS